MAETSTTATSGRRHRPDWQRREVRASPKMVARRVTTDDHAVLKRFAEANGTAIAEMIAPAVDALIEQAREFCQDLDSQQQDSHARAS